MGWLDSLKRKIRARTLRENINKAGRLVRQSEGNEHSPYAKAELARAYEDAGEYKRASGLYRDSVKEAQQFDLKDAQDYRDGLSAFTARMKSPTVSDAEKRDREEYTGRRVREVLKPYPYPEMKQKRDARINKILKKSRLLSKPAVSVLYREKAQIHEDDAREYRHLRIEDSIFTFGLSRKVDKREITEDLLAAKNYAAAGDIQKAQKLYSKAENLMDRYKPGPDKDMEKLAGQTSLAIRSSEKQGTKSYEPPLQPSAQTLNPNRLERVVEMPHRKKQLESQVAAVLAIAMLSFALGASIKISGMAVADSLPPYMSYLPMVLFIAGVFFAWLYFKKKD